MLYLWLAISFGVLQIYLFVHSFPSFSNYSSLGFIHPLWFVESHFEGFIQKTLLLCLTQNLSVRLSLTSLGDLVSFEDICSNFYMWNSHIYRFRAGESSFWIFCIKILTFYLKPSVKDFSFFLFSAMFST